jgi:predicted metal-dependent hydrolase
MGANVGCIHSGLLSPADEHPLGACNHRASTIRLNTELVKKPRDLLEYVIVHEMLHLIERSHGSRFVDLLDGFYPTWREARMELNELPLAASTRADA